MGTSIMKNTPILLDLAVTKPYSLSDLRDTKFHYNLTDFGLIQCVEVSLSTGRCPACIARIMRDMTIAWAL